MEDKSLAEAYRKGLRTERKRCSECKSIIMHWNKSGLCWTCKNRYEENCMGSHSHSHSHSHRCREEWEKKQEEKKDTKSEGVKK